MANFINPFRPGAGHTPPYLAGRTDERIEFLKLLDQSVILENTVITGLRGVGKTVLLDSLKPLAISKKWLWVGTDLSEAASLSEDNMATRLCADLALITSTVVLHTVETQPMGFQSQKEVTERRLNFNTLIEIYNTTPGLSLDKVKKVIEISWNAISRVNNNDVKGIIFAYDEAQNLSDQAKKDQFPLSLLLDAFQSLQKQNIPVMLVLTGLPTLFPKLVEARTFSERMFRVLFLNSLTNDESKQAILKPIDDCNCPIKLSKSSVDSIVKMSGGYPYFIQFICKEVYDSFIQKIDKGENAYVPVNEIEQKLDTDFFAGRWSRATDRQRELMTVIAELETSSESFAVQEVVEKSENILEKPFGNSNVNQMLNNLINQGLIFKNSHGKYSFAVPLLDRYIRREKEK